MACPSICASPSDCRTRMRVFSKPSNARCARDVTKALRIDKLVVIGVGLIGGSLALALREANVVREVVGIGRTRANLATATARSIVDRALTLDDVWTHELT